MATGAFTIQPRDPPPQSDWAARPRYAVSDFATLLWRERVLMLAIFLLILVSGIGFAFTLHKTYPAHSSVLVRLGQEYVYEPRAGDAARGAVPNTDQLIQSETEILASDALKLRVIRRLGFARLFPKAAAKYAAATPDKRATMLGDAVVAMSKAMGIETAPDTSVIRVSYEHEDAATAALVLNSLLEEYLVYRRSVLVDPSTPALEQQRQSFEARLAEADTAYETFLTENRIGDFVAEKTSLSQLQAQVEAQQYAVQTQLQERQGRLATLNAQLTQVAPEIGLYRDTDSSLQNELTKLRVQRESLLSRYRPESQPVHDLDIQIAQLESALAAGRAQGDSARRVGVNPVYQTLQTDRIQLTAEVAALQASLATLNGQVEQLTQRRLRLAELEPRFTALSRDRDVLSGNVREFAIREQQSQASAQIAARTNDNIRIVERASVPTQGKSLRKPVAILAFLFAGFTALCVGLLRMFLRPGLPTAASAARTLELPVLASAGVKAA